ncbi:MAG: right-handed parallel beta-helix repeat-containing protein [Phycisphaerales bacterium]
MNLRNRVVIGSITALAAGAGLLIAGPLNPPGGAVSSTMKTLAEVEPRIAIIASNTPGDTDSLFKITQPGSYYLTGNITGVPGKRGIEIASNDVTIDLNGFTLRGVTGALDGITSMLSDATGISVVNGVVRDWPLHGINIGSGPVFGGHVDAVCAESNGVDGIRVGNQVAVTRCSSVNNGDRGFAGATTCTFSNCASRGNGSTGYYCTTSCTYGDCTAYLNGSHGFESAYDTAAYENCTSSYNNGDGFRLAAANAITGCSAGNNKGSGILIDTRCIVRGCTAYANAVGAAVGSNIKVIGTDNRVMDNNCAAGLRGIQVTVSGSFICRNTCTGNTTNWDVVAGNACLVVNATMGGAISGNSGGSAPGSSDPNANFTY